MLVSVSNTGFYYLIKRDGPTATEFCNQPDWGSDARNTAFGDPG